MEREYIDVSEEINYVIETVYENKEHVVEWTDGHVTHRMQLNLEERTGTGTTGIIKRTSDFLLNIKLK